MCLVALLAGTFGLAAEPLRLPSAKSVIVFAGGENASELAKTGYLETILSRAWPDFALRFRNLAWEGDTVLEQRRELNFPSWEEQLQSVEASLVFLQFGQAESYNGSAKLAEFTKAYQSLLRRTIKPQRRVILLSPTPFESPRPGSALPDLLGQNKSLLSYSQAIRSLAAENGCEHIDLTEALGGENATRDGWHWNDRGHWLVARAIAKAFSVDSPSSVPKEWAELVSLVREKNQLWDRFWRPQNWAFLAGDRTEQPSSRDHRDPKIRWFPAEMERFRLMIASKEREIDDLAERLKVKP